MGIVSLQDVLDGIKAIHSEPYNKGDELQKLMFQSKSEYLIRDKMDLFFFDRFGKQGLFPIREWKTFERWGLGLEHAAHYVMPERWKGTAEEFALLTDEEWAELEGKIVKELSDLNKDEWDLFKLRLPKLLQEFMFRYSGTSAIDLALFRDYSQENPPINGDPPFILDTLIEFKCEVLHQLNPKLIKGYSGQIQRMKNFNILRDASYYLILCLVHFPNGVQSKYFPLNTHYENNKRNRGKFSIDRMTNKFEQEFAGRYKYLSADDVCSRAKYLNTDIEFHYWVIFGP